MSTRSKIVDVVNGRNLSRTWCKIAPNANKQTVLHSGNMLRQRGVIAGLNSTSYRWDVDSVLTGTLIQPVSTGLIDVNKSPFLAIHHWPLPSGTKQKSRAIAGKSRDDAIYICSRDNASSHCTWRRNHYSLICRIKIGSFATYTLAITLNLV